MEYQNPPFKQKQPKRNSRWTEKKDTHTHTYTLKNNPEIKEKKETQHPSPIPSIIDNIITFHNYLMMMIMRWIFLWRSVMWFFLMIFFIVLTSLFFLHPSGRFPMEKEAKEYSIFFLFSFIVVDFLLQSSPSISWTANNKICVMIITWWIFLVAFSDIFRIEAVGFIMQIRQHANEQVIRNIQILEESKRNYR